MEDIRELHLFAGIGGGIYGGKLLGHKCSGAVEIDEHCKDVLLQRQKDGWMNEFPIYDDLTELDGTLFKGTFDVLCGGFPCQAFSHAARGRNISSKNLWGEMFRFAKESDAPVVFGENVTSKAITMARKDLDSIGYVTQVVELSCGELGGDHRRTRFWLLGVKDTDVFNKIAQHLSVWKKLKASVWNNDLEHFGETVPVENRFEQLRGVGNAQSPYVAATAFRILVNRYIRDVKCPLTASRKEISEVFEVENSWIKRTYGMDFGYISTPVTIPNYSCSSMQKHQGCRNFVTVFKKATPTNAEYLMGFPCGASAATPLSKTNIDLWYEGD